MKWLTFFGAILFVTLFVATTFSSSPAAQAEAAKYFGSNVIENGLEYAHQRRLLFWSYNALRLGLLVMLVTTSLARRIADWCNRRTGGRWLLTILLMGLVIFIAEELLALPFALGRFELSSAWGLTSRPWTDWLADHLKGMAVTAGTDGIVLIGLYLLMRRWPRRWWLAATLGGTALGIAYAFLAPVVIEPIFNTFTPLQATKWANLEGMVRDLATRAGVPVKDILVVDASRQGNHSNAYFTGFGSTQRIVLYDNLLKKHSKSEMESILAHEIGHWQHHHIVKGIALGAAASLLGLWVLSLILRLSVGRGWLALRSPADPAGLPLILLVGAIGFWLAMPLENAVSRSFERQADETALELGRRPDAFKAAEIQLAEDNIGNVAPDPLSVWLFATHPPPVERIRMADEWEKKHRR